MLSVLETDTDKMATNTLVIVMFDYLNSDIISYSDDNTGGGDLLDKVMSIRSYLSSVVNIVYASENVTPGVYNLMQQKQLIGCVVPTPDQVSIHTGILNMVMFGSILIGNKSVGNIYSFSLNLNVDIAINIGKAVSSNKSNITAHQNGISATQTMLNIVLIDMLKNGLPGEPGFVGDSNNTILKIDAKRSSTDDTNMWGNDYKEYAQATNIVNNSGLNELNCLLNIQPSSLYHWSADETKPLLTNVLSLSLTNTSAYKKAIDRHGIVSGFFTDDNNGDDETGTHLRQRLESVSDEFGSANAINTSFCDVFVFFMSFISTYMLQVIVIIQLSKVNQIHV